MKNFQKVLITSTAASFLCATAPAMLIAQEAGPHAPCLLGGESYSQYYAVGLGDKSLRCEEGNWVVENDPTNPANCVYDNGTYSAGAVISMRERVGIVCMNGGNWETWTPGGGT